MTSGIRRQVTPLVLFSLVMLLYLSGLSIVGLGWPFTMAAVLFFLLALWPELIGDRAALTIDLSTLTSIYVFTCAAFGLGLIAQYVIFEFFGIPLWNIGLFKGRIAMAFIWNDYSYASAYTASGALLAVRHFRQKLFGASLAGILIIATLVTTGRAGLAALMLFLFMKIFYDSAFARSRNTSGRRGILAAGVLLLMMVGIFLSFQERYNRNLDLSAAGRLEGYSTAVAIFERYPAFGILMPQAQYELFYGAIPHNVFLHLAVFGGVLLLAGMIVWAGMVFFLTRRATSYLREAALVVVIALQFIPSLFSAYFLAVLVGLCLLSARQARLRPVEPQGVAASELSMMARPMIAPARR